MGKGDSVRHFHAGQSDWHSHDDQSFHIHSEDEIDDERLAALERNVWNLSNVQFVTVGVDIGSSTSHMMFSRVHLRRSDRGLSSRFVVVGREVVWRSPILLTPYLPNNLIDALALGDFIRAAYDAADLRPADIDTGAVILTGEALKRDNAHAIADLFANEAGKFVCASAGHHLEALMAAHGSGAVALSRDLGKTVLNVDIGGGTTKLSLIRNGNIEDTCAVAIGSRLLAHGAGRRLIRVEGPARRVGLSLDLTLDVGAEFDEGLEGRIVSAFVETLTPFILQTEPTELGHALQLTPGLRPDIKPDSVVFSGGVSEYIYGRETEDYGDLGPSLAASLLNAVSDGSIPIPIIDAGQGIRATVIGASQYSVQLSGNTIGISDPSVLPLRNLPVVPWQGGLEQDFSAADIAHELGHQLERLNLVDGEDHFALWFPWTGVPSHRRLRTLAQGIFDALPKTIQSRIPVVVLIDADIGKALGNILKRELAIPGEVITIDGLELRELDYVDIGEVVLPADVVPVLIKSLLFSDFGRDSRPHEVALEQ